MTSPSMPMPIVANDESMYMAKLCFMKPSNGPNINPIMISTGIYTIDDFLEMGIENAATMRMKLIS